MINFYHRFLPHIAKTLKSLTFALKGSSKLLVWIENMTTAFSATKEALISTMKLNHPNPSAQLSLAVDALDTHVGAVLQQLQMEIRLHFHSFQNNWILLNPNVPLLIENYWLPILSFHPIFQVYVGG